MKKIPWADLALWVPTLFLVYVFARRGPDKFNDSGGWARAFARPRGPCVMSDDTPPGLADLVERARDPRAPLSAQHAAFATLVERFEEMAFAIACKACRDSETARDACQEAFVTAWRMLPRLREPEAFGGWLRRLVRTQCSRAARRLRTSAAIRERAADEAARSQATDSTADHVHRDEVRLMIRRAVEALPALERETIIRICFLGESLRATARATGVPIGTAGKRAYSARLRLRRALPRSVAAAFLEVAPSEAFSRRVRAGVFDEYVGEYRFASRPVDRVVVCREGDRLVCFAGGQRNVLASRAQDTLVPTEFDGEGRFERDRRGRIRGFVYYEFGRRLGVARKLARC